MLEAAAVFAVLSPLISELLTPIAKQVGEQVGEKLGALAASYVPERKKQALVEYAKAKDARDKELLSLTDAQVERRLQLQEQELRDRRELSTLQRELMRELQAKEIQVKLAEIQINWDKNTWFSNLSRQETEQILQQQQHRLLILLSPPEISPDCPASFRNNLEIEMRSIGKFLSQHYPQQDKLRSVKFYSDYFTKSIADIDVERLQRILAPVPTAILYSDISDYAVTFHIGFWGLPNSEVSLFSTEAWNWEQAKDALLAAGQNETKALRIIRQLIVTIHKLLAAFLADLYYLNIDPNYEPLLLNLESQFAKEGLAQEWVNPYIEILKDIQQRQRQVYELELKRLADAETEHQWQAEAERQRRKQEERQWQERGFRAKIRCLGCKNINYVRGNETNFSCRSCRANINVAARKNELLFDESFSTNEQELKRLADAEAERRRRKQEEERQWHERGFRKKIRCPSCKNINYVRGNETSFSCRSCRANINVAARKRDLL